MRKYHIEMVGKAETNSYHKLHPALAMQSGEKSKRAGLHI